MGLIKKLAITIAVIILILLLLIVIFYPGLFQYLDFRTFNEGYELEEAYPNLEFDDLVHLTHDGTSTMYAVEQSGTIYSFENNPDTTDKSLFLDISDQVQTGPEAGLLGLAFDPNFLSNGYFYVDYTRPDPLTTVVSRFQVMNGEVDITSELIIFTQEQPYGNHNAGTIIFGPDDLLYITLGDGGASGDPHDNGQDLSTYLGSILRINVSGATETTPYTIPSDNPFVNREDALDEIWAYGLRNPWKITFDSETGVLWAGDVGQNKYEEIDIIEKGKNYGWDTMEGFHCFEPEDNCDQTGLTLPITEYGRDKGASVSGGYVYRGSEVPNLYGKYIYADYVVGRFWFLDASNPDEPNATDFMKYNKLISGFGVDNQNELYVLGYGGSIYKIVPNQ